MGGFAHHMFTTRKKFYGIRRHDLLIQCFFVEQITIEKVRKNITHSLIKVAGATGLEPATSCVTGRRSNQLNYTPDYNRMVGDDGLEPPTLSV